MPIDPPSSAALDRVSRHYGLALSESDVASFAPAVAGLMSSWDAVERLYAEIAPTAPDRAWKRPAEADNPLGAWYVTTSITGREGGPLTGRSVTIKDNTAVAGVPMMNGSLTLEGYVPARDATVVTRLLDAGATIVGKAVCEDLCFSGGSHTSRTGPVRNPWGTARSRRWPGLPGDPRASSQNDLTAEFLGDYVYTAATRAGAVGVWNDVRNGADCPAIDAWRLSLRTGTTVAKPAPQQDCPTATFGNTDIFGAAVLDPTP